MEMGGRVVRWVALVGAFFCLATLNAPKAEAADKVKFTMDWIITGSHAPFFSGLDQGHYRGAGVEPAIERGFGGADSIKKLAAGATDFAFADVGSMVVARSRGALVKALAVVYDRPQYVFYTIKGAGIRTPKDLEGRTIANNVGGVVRDLFPALAAANQVDESKVKWLIVDAAMIFPALLSGQADLAGSFAVNKPILEAKAREQGKEIVGIYFGDWGVDIYSNGILTTDDRITKNPDLVRRFVQASLESIAWTAENPDAAVALLVKHHPAVDVKIGRETLRVALESTLTPTIREKGLGYMSEEKMTRTRDILTKYMKLPATVPVKDLYTLDFLPGIKVRAR